MKDFIVSDDNIEFVKACVAAGKGERRADGDYAFSPVHVTLSCKFSKLSWRQIAKLALGCKLFVEQSFYCSQDIGMTLKDKSTAEIKLDEGE